MTITDNFWRHQITLTKANNFTVRADQLRQIRTLNLYTLIKSDTCWRSTEKDWHLCLQSRYLLFTSPFYPLRKKKYININSVKNISTWSPPPKNTNPLSAFSKELYLPVIQILMGEGYAINTILIFTESHFKSENMC